MKLLEIIFSCRPTDERERISHCIYDKMSTFHRGTAIFPVRKSSLRGHVGGNALALFLGRTSDAQWFFPANFARLAELCIQIARKNRAWDFRRNESRDDENHANSCKRENDPDARRNKNYGISRCRFKSWTIKSAVKEESRIFARVNLWGNFFTR